jgi:type I restriction enzyme S subunit
MSTTTLHSEKKKALIPKLRFSGFDKNWETITLGDLLTFKNGLNSDKEKYGKGVKFINVLDILNNDFITYDKIIGSVEVTEKEFEKNEVSYGDILFQRSSETRAEVGQANVYLDRNKSSVFGGFVIRGKAKSEYEPLFMNYLLRTPIARKEITDKSGGSTRYNVGQDTLSKVQLTTTIISEQQKIASFLSAVDEKIQQLYRKKELLEQYKKGVTQQLFSGKLRFNDENGEDYADWEKKKLGEVSTKKSSNISANKIEDNLGEFIIYGASGILKKVDFYKEENDYISIVKDGAGVGRLLYCKGKSSVLGTMEIIIPKQNIDTYFLYCLLSNIDFVKYVTGSTIPHIYFKDYSNEFCGIPSLQEQQKIAAFLSSIDTKIESTSQQINQMQSFKKGLLQQLFV